MVEVRQELSDTPNIKNYIVHDCYLIMPEVKKILVLWYFATIDYLDNSIQNSLLMFAVSSADGNRSSARCLLVCGGLSDRPERFT